MPFETIAVEEDTSLYLHVWDLSNEPRTVVQIAHGLAEHGGRYARLAGALNVAGYAVYAADHRGHGNSIGSRDDLGFFATADGWRKCLDDLWTVNRRIAELHPGLPIILLGHSMGSLLAQQFMTEHGDALAGVVLSGSDASPPLAGLGRLVARLERMRLGPRGRSRLLNRLAFGAYNQPFAPARTAFDWLSREPAEVDRYLADPLCGFVPTTQLWIDLLDGLALLPAPERLARIPKNLPVLVMAGADDPVSAQTTRLGDLLVAYRRAGLLNVTHRFYPGARHELFNETNRDEVITDLILWVEEVLKVRAEE